MVLKGSVDSFKYINETNRFGIFYFSTPDVEEGNIVVTGNVFGISEGDYIEITGTEVDHPVYGKQIKMTSFKAVQPTDTESIIKYLASGALRGVGPKLALRIFSTFGEDTLRILENEPERLAEVKGISLNMAQNIAIEYQEKKSMRDAMIFLQKYNISNVLAAKIYDEYEENIYTIVKEHPYKIAEDVVGVGFKTVDEIAMNGGIPVNSEERVEAGICYVLSNAMEEGHTYLPREILIETASELLKVTGDLVEECLVNVTLSGKVKQIKPDKIFLKGIFLEETYCANKLKQLKDAFIEVEETKEERELFEKDLKAIEDKYSFELDDSQKLAIDRGINNGIFLLTGGPGTGKTTIIKALIEFFYNAGSDVMLAAPTGRAAKRMKEATGYEAKTLHRLLEAGAVSDNRNKMRFAKNESNQLEANVYIIDEMSMVDVFLFAAFLKAVPVGSRVILVGDMNQLPSVGPGNIFKDLISCGFFATSTLEKIHRQSEDSQIIVNAHMVNKGNVPPLDKNSENKDFFFLERSDRRIIVRDTIDLLMNRIPGKFGADPFDIQVLSPSRKGELGVEALNKTIQEYVNPKKPGKAEIVRGDNIFRVGDKVMQTKNNYDIPWVIRGKNGIEIEEGTGVFNGDIGKIIGVNTFEKSITVLFDDSKEVTYERDEAEEIETAYVTTIHKAQGSEFPAIILVILDTPKQLLSRNLLYTGITRATKCVMILGSSQKVGEMVENDSEKRRFTDLSERLKEVMA